MPFKDPARRSEYHKAYKRANRHRYRYRQKAYDAATHANEKALRLGVAGTLTPEDIEALLSAGRCGHCDGQFDYYELEVDHWVPFSNPMCRNTPDNLVASCEPCNARKAAKPALDAWSVKHSSCVNCGATDHRHIARGLCSPCYWQEYERTHPGRRSKAHP